MGILVLEGVIRRPGVRQFVKFCIVGCSSLAIDYKISQYLTFALGIDWRLAQCVSFLVAVTNGFIWNSLWTFRGMGQGVVHERYIKFALVNVIGLLLNLVIMNVVLFFLTGRVSHANPDPLHWKIAKMTSVLCVSFWNFFANRRWTYRKEVRVEPQVT